MTNPLISWIDRDRWASLLQGAVSDEPAPQRPAVAPPPSRATVPTVKAPTSVAPQAKTPISIAPGIPPSPSLPSSIAPPLDVVPFAPSSNVLDTRLHELVRWIEVVTHCRAAFIADDNGLPVVEHVAAEQAQIAAASSILLMLASVRSMLKDTGTWMSLKTSSSVFHVVEVETHWGRFAVGVVCDYGLPFEFLTVLSAAVVTAFRADPLTGSDL
jgi:hypothetical protein